MFFSFLTALLFSLSAHAGTLPEARQLAMTKNAPLWTAMGITTTRAFAKPARDIRIAIVGEGMRIEQHPEYIDTIPGHNFTSGSGELAALSEGMLSSHEQNILGLLDLTARKLGFNKNLKVLPMVVTKNFYEFDDYFFKKIADAIRYSADLGVDAISVSQGSAYTTAHFLFVNNDRTLSLKYVQDAIDYAHRKGVAVFGAASNDKAKNHDTEPAALCNLPKVICVGNNDFTGKVISASGVKSVDVTYFGEKLSTWDKNNDPSTVTGTSFATPILALLYAYSKNVNGESAQQTLTRLEKSTGLTVTARYGVRIKKVATLSDLHLMD